MKFIQGFFMSFGMFCAIPCPYRPWNEKARNLMVMYLPVVGLVIGLLWYAVYLLLDAVNLPLQLQAACLMLFPFLVTGAIHLDGYMDTMDAILSRRSLEEKRRILKDPHTGAFAVIALAVLLILCYAAMSSVLETAHFKRALDLADKNPLICLILIPVMTRCGSSLTVLKGRPLPDSQYNGDCKKSPTVGELGFIVLAGCLCFAGAIFMGIRSAPHFFFIPIVLIVAALSYAAAIGYAGKQLGGVSGDLAGYSLTIAEAAAMVAMALV